MNAAIVYDRVNKWGGAERVLLALSEIFPDAPLYTSVYNPKTARWANVFPKVITSFLQNVPLATDRHEHFPYLMPLAFESFDLSGYDLVISVTSEAAKGVIVKPPAKHICYCLTPTRYLWSHHDFYFKNPPAMLGKIPFFYYLSRPFVNYMRSWDKIAAQRPDAMVAISNAVRRRIKKYYGRDSKVIYPPTEIDKFRLKRGEKVKKENYYLYVSRLIPYKRADLAIEAFSELNLPLVVVGTGSEERRLKSVAKSNIKFVGQLTDDELANYYKRCVALIFPQEEDFGIVVLEAQAAGTPVIAFNKGGALDTIIDGKTGIFFQRQNKKSLITAVKKFEQMEFKRDDLIKNAERFSKRRFQKRFMDLVKKQ